VTAHWLNPVPLPCEAPACSLGSATHQQRTALSVSRHARDAFFHPCDRLGNDIPAVAIGSAVRGNPARTCPIGATGLFLSACGQ